MTALQGGSSEHVRDRPGRSNRPPRLAFFLPTLHGGGAQRAILNLAKALHARGFAVEIVVGDARGELASLVPPEVTTVDLRCPHLRSALLPLARYLRTSQPDCLLSTVNHANVLALLTGAIAGSPTKIVVRVSDMLSAKGERPSLRDRLTFALARRLYRRADLLIALSHGSAADAAHVVGLPLEKVPIVPSPLVPENLPVLLKEPIDHPFFQPGGPPVVLGVGRLVSDKDFASLVRAFKLVRTAQRARLVILGEGTLRGDLERLARECGVSEDVALLGFVRNPFKYMGAAAVYVLTCQNEGMPGSLVQAMACGVPVVATDCPSGPRELLHEGKYGTLVPMGDVVAMAEAVSRALRQPRVPAPPESWQVYRTDQAVEAYARLLNELLALHSRPACYPRG